MKKLASLFALAVLLSIGLDARALSISDLYYKPGEDGWGANIIQQSNILFITIFVYGTNGQPTWLVGPATTLQSSGSYSGTLYQTTGPWYGTTFNPGSVANRQVGTVTFTHNPVGESTLAYTVDGTSVAKQVVRQTWAALPANGTYYGTMTQQTSSTCNRITEPLTYYARFSILTAGAGSGTVTFNFATYQGSTNTFPQSCTITGPFRQYGSQIAQTTDTSFTCYLGSGRGQALFDVQAQGITGVVALGNATNTCADTYSVFASRG